jgi:predicted dehydrogenase
MSGRLLTLLTLDKAAIDALSPGDAVIIFTPDPSHYPIALYALERKIHVLVTKPATKLLSHHQELIDKADENGVVCWVEHHKRVSTTSLARSMSMIDKKADRISTV